MTNLGCHIAAHEFSVETEQTCAINDVINVFQSKNSLFNCNDGGSGLRLNDGLFVKI